MHLSSPLPLRVTYLALLILLCLTTLNTKILFLAYMVFKKEGVLFFNVRSRRPTQVSFFANSNRKVSRG